MYILYIQKNAGKRDTFDWLVENLMTVRSLPLYDFTMKHNVSEMITERNEFNSYYPDITFRRNPVNYKNIESSNTFVSLELINSKFCKPNIFVKHKFKEINTFVSRDVYMDYIKKSKYTLIIPSMF